MKIVKRREGRTPFVDNTIEVRPEIASMQSFKEFLGQQKQPVWLVSLKPETATYATLHCVQAPFRVEKFEPKVRCTDHVRFMLWGETGAAEKYQITYPELGRTRGVYPSEYFQRRMSIGLSSPLATETIHYVTGEDNIAAQLQMWGIDDPRRELASPAELTEKAEVLFANRSFQAGGLARILDQMGFVRYAITQLRLTGRDALKCVHILFEQHADALKDSTLNALYAQ
jgi:hypothetical protein